MGATLTKADKAVLRLALATARDAWERRQLNSETIARAPAGAWGKDPEQAARAASATARRLVALDLAAAKLNLMQ